MSKQRKDRQPILLDTHKADMLLTNGERPYLVTAIDTYSGSIVSCGIFVRPTLRSLNGFLKRVLSHPGWLGKGRS